MDGVKIGCGGYAGRRETYFRKFPVIEVDQTFYDPPRVFTAEKWRREAPDHFEFTVRAWQLITHPADSPSYRRLQARLNPQEQNEVGHFQPTEIVWNGWQRTREIALALRAQTIVFQCPEAFTPTEENKENLRRFFTRLHEESKQAQDKFTCVWEPHSDWQAAEVAELCRELDLIQAADPFFQQPVAADVGYLRLNGIRGYRHHYSEEELTILMDIVNRYRAGYCIFNNLHMREAAARLAWMIYQAKNPKEDEQDAA